ncbi:hypothetical protein I79_010280 [Cricetulus griseus]|uniref:Uncharacterized protein n=1 Tax=Cricetulus griseus TaxID=10029 RepID=G3HI16_CRIGR|nr:hypothetical protein I79_010280 [Cricetulus griseus]
MFLTKTCLLLNLKLSVNGTETFFVVLEIKQCLLYTRKGLYHGTSFSALVRFLKVEMSPIFSYGKRKWIIWYEI